MSSEGKPPRDPRQRPPGEPDLPARASFPPPAAPAPLRLGRAGEEAGSSLLRVAKSGGAWRVHGAWPGERVALRPREDDPGYARLAALVDPAPERRPWRCPHAARCGGCHWLHVTPEAQRARRRAELERALATAGVSLARTHVVEAPASRELGYRARTRAQIDPGPPLGFGFHELGGRRVVDVTRCPLLTPEAHAGWAALRRALEAEAPEAIAELSGAELVALPGAPGALVFLNPRDRAPAAWPALGERLVARAEGALAGVAVRPARDLERDVIGARAILGRLPSGRPLAAGARAFLQAHLEGADALAAEVARLAGAAPGRRVVELYAGSGLLGWRLAEAGAAVRAIERDTDALAAAALLPAPSCGRLEHVRASDAEDELARLEALAAREPMALPDALVADPPRSGLGPLAARAGRLGLRRLVLASCSARAFARDAAALEQSGLRLAELVLCDLFPQTRHLECVGLFTTKKAAPKDAAEGREVPSRGP